jgi:tetratricopeptide (TPR) repeat protein
VDESEESEDLRRATALWRAAYRFQMEGELDEAIAWLEQAKQTRRYEPRQFPFMNLGCVYLKLGRWWDALREFEGAVQVAPRDVHAAKTLHHLRGQLN